MLSPEQQSAQKIRGVVLLVKMGRKAGEAAKDQQKTSKIQLCTGHRGLRLQELHFKGHGVVTESCQSGTEQRQGAIQALTRMAGARERLEYFGNAATLWLWHDCATKKGIYG